MGMKESEGFLDRFTKTYQLLEGNLPAIPLLIGWVTSHKLLYLERFLGNSSENPLPGYLLSTSIFILGRLADRLSTIQASKAAIQANELGIKYSAREMNPSLPPYPTKKDIFSRRWAFIDSALLTVGVVYPPLGIALGSLFTTDAIGNKLTEKYLKRRIDKVIQTHYPH